MWRDKINKGNLTCNRKSISQIKEKWERETNTKKKKKLRKFPQKKMTNSKHQNTEIVERANVKHSNSIIVKF